MKWRILVLSPVVALMVSGQAALKFAKSGISKDEFESDKRQCITVAVSGRPELTVAATDETTGKPQVLLEGIELTSEEHRVALVCMLEKGYRFVTNVDAKVVTTPLQSQPTP
jgi:hypothetical protein